MLNLLFYHDFTGKNHRLFCLIRCNLSWAIESFNYGSNLFHNKFARSSPYSNTKWMLDFLSMWKQSSFDCSKFRKWHHTNALSETQFMREYKHGLGHSLSFLFINQIKCLLMGRKKFPGRPKKAIGTCECYEVIWL